MFSYRNAKRVVLGAACGVMIALAAQAQDYPSKPITLIVPWGAGGGTDTLARTFAKMLAHELGQPINVVNRTGAGGLVGHTAIATAEPDGYTLGVGTVEYTTYNALGQSDLEMVDYTQLCRLASLPAGITVHADSEFEDASQLLDAIRESPEGTYTSSGSGVGGAWHLSVAGWLSEEGVAPGKVRFVPSKGGAAALQDVVARGITMYTGSVNEGKPLADAGQVKLLAVMHPERLDALPDVPTIQEATGTQWSASSWYPFLAPAGLPEEIKEELITAGKKVWESDAFTSFMTERGYVPAGECGDDFAAFAAQESETAAKVIQQLGIAQ